VKEEEEEEDDQPLESAEPAPSHCKAVGASSHVSSLQFDISELTQIYRSWHEQYRCRFGSTSVHITEIQKI
jgi:hypothetical protein